MSSSAPEANRDAPTTHGAAANSDPDSVAPHVTFPAATTSAQHLLAPPGRCAHEPFDAAILSQMPHPASQQLNSPLAPDERIPSLAMHVAAYKHLPPWRQNGVPSSIGAHTLSSQASPVKPSVQYSQRVPTAFRGHSQVKLVAEMLNGYANPGGWCSADRHVPRC